MERIDVELAALSDPTRRQVVERLTEGPSRTNELAEAIGVSVPAISRHLRMLRERGLVERTDVDGDGRGRQYQLNADGLDAVATWFRNDHWATRLGAAGSTPKASELLTRVGGFLDGFANADADFFATHLADDAELIFPGTSTRWDKTSTIASVSDHAPYVAWSVSAHDVRPLAAGLTLMIVEVAVRTTATEASRRVVQSMVFDDTTEPWTLRFLQQTPSH